MRTNSPFTITVAIVVAMLVLTPLHVVAQTGPAVSGRPMPDETTIAAQMDALLDARVQYLMDNMDAADRVGQLFVVNFAGSDTGFDSDIAPLIHAYRIGGVVISPRYENFDNAHGTDTPRTVAGLTNRLQALAYGKLLDPDRAVPAAGAAEELVRNLPDLADVSPAADRTPVNIPLLVAAEQLGDSIDHTVMRRSFTTLPTQMAIGATWDPQLAYQIGSIVGRELAAVGVNLLLGPNLDVLAVPRPDSVGKLGVDMYGGNPFWVSEMAEAYIAGVHVGSSGQMLTVARHFPGQGDVDRLPSQEVATIQTSLDGLRTIALAPFQRVMQLPNGDDAGNGITDAIMPSNMRYSAIQGTGPQRIPPFGLSLELDMLLAQEGFEEWRTHGLVMSNALGLPAIRRHFAAESEEFPVNNVARNALLVGNDLLYLGLLSPDGDWDTERVDIEATVSFFQERYAADADFADAVDRSVARILRAKLQLFTDREELRQDALDMLTIGATANPNVPTVRQVDERLATEQVVSQEPIVPLDDVLVTSDRFTVFDPDGPAMNESAAVVRQVARAAITTLYPDTTAPTETLPRAPAGDEGILIFTDSRLQRECTTCVAQVAVGPEDLSHIILRLYGPDATGQVQPEQIVNRTFTELAELLDAEPEPTATPSVFPEPTPTVASAPVTPFVSTPVPGTIEAPAQDADPASSDLLPDIPLEREIADASWIIFNMLDVDPERYPSSDVVKRFLRERGADLDDKQIIVLALNAPYFLDATEISDLSAYLGVYARSQPFLENAVRVLFRSFPPTGAPPVDVPGTRFADLSERLQSDPARPLPLDLFVGDEPLESNAPDDGPADTLEVSAGNTVRIQVGPVMDHNNHVVPDGTEVTFQVIYEGAELALSVRPAETRAGFAVREILLERSGSVSIVAASGRATSQPIRRITVIDSSATIAVGSTPNSQPDETISGTDDLVATRVLAGGESDAPSSATNSARRVNLATLLVALFTMLITLSMLLIVQVRILPRTMLVHNLLWAVIVGWSAYIVYGVGLLPGGNWLHGQLDLWSAALVMFMGMIAPMLWLQLRSLRD